MNRKIGVILTLFVLQVFTALSQKEFLQEADNYFKGGQLVRAIDAYQRAYTRARTPEEKGYISFQLGECHRKAANPGKAEEFYQRCVELKYSNSEHLLRLAEVQRDQGKYEDALKNYQKYASSGGNNREAQLGIESSKQALEMKKATTRYVIQEVAVLNTEYYDMVPVFGDRQGKELYFTSNRPGSTGEDLNDRKMGPNGDVWVTIKDPKGHWGQPEIVAGVNSGHDEGAIAFNSKFTEMYFTRCEKDPKGKKSLGCNIWMVTKKGKKWEGETMVELKPKDNDSLTVGHPALAPDDSYMIFASDMPGGQGGRDLWMTKYDKREKKWMEPVNLGPGINTPGDELFPYIHPKTGALFFSSNGHPGMGGLDIFKAEKSGDAAWARPENFGTPINSNAHDYAIMFEGDDYSRGFFTSNRKGSSPGGAFTLDDIYSFSLPPMNFSLVTTVRDIETKEPIAGVSISVTGSNNTSYIVKTDENGQFTFDKNEAGDPYILVNTNYNILVEGNEDVKVNAARDAFSTMGETTSKKYIKDFYVKIVTPNTVWRVPEVRYDYDSDILQVNDSVNSKDSLNFLYDLMVENPTWVVQLRSHTDCRGSDKYNEDLSLRRAKACVVYLTTEKGIHPDRIVPVGMGKREAIPGLECDKISKLPTKQEQEAAHQRNRRTDFKVISFDFVPK